MGWVFEPIDDHLDDIFRMGWALRRAKLLGYSSLGGTLSKASAAAPSASSAPLAIRNGA